MVMKTQWPPDADSVVGYFKPLSGLLRNGLDFGCDQAVTYFESLKVTGRLDPWLYSHLARFHTLRWLALNGLVSSGFQPVDLPLSGIWLRSAELDVRILKIDRRPNPDKTPNRRIQAQNVSPTRRAYYCQPTMELDTGNGAAKPPRVRLLVLWDNDSAYQLDVLDWACPKWLNETKRTVETHWWLPIPAEGITSGERLADVLAQTYVLDDVEPLTDQEDDAATSRQ